MHFTTRSTHSSQALLSSSFHWSTWSQQRLECTVTAQGTEEKSFNQGQVAHTSESRKIKKGLGADSSKKTRMFMVCHSTCHILILSFGMCYLVGTKCTRQRVFTFLKEHKSTPLIGIFSLSHFKYFGNGGEERGCSSSKTIFEDVVYFRV